MIKDVLKETQPIVYQTLQNALRNNKLAHAFLFTGGKGTPKKETAIFLAQTLICENKEDVFACETCDTCRRIQEMHYSDILYLDGNEESIKKKSILAIQEQFAKTALEKSGKKIYILDHAENASVEALNSLLKFLEEPNGNDTTAILIVDSVDRLLPTIVSRCQIIPFKPIKAETIYEEAVQEGIDPVDSYVISYLGRNTDEVKEIMENEEYQIALQVAKKFTETFDTDIDSFLLWFQTEILSRNRDKNKSVMLYTFTILAQFFKDEEMGKDLSLSWYSEQIQRIQDKNYPIDQIILLLLQSKEKCNKSYDLALVMDQFVMNIKEAIQ